MGTSKYAIGDQVETLIPTTEWPYAKRVSARIAAVLFTGDVYMVEIQTVTSLIPRREDELYPKQEKTVKDVSTELKDVLDKVNGVIDNHQQEEFTGENMQFRIVDATEGQERVLDTFKGFCDAEGVDPKDWSKSPMVVAAIFDGEPELWLVENDEGIKELRRHYEQEWGPGRVYYVIMKPVECRL